MAIGFGSERSGWLRRLAAVAVAYPLVFAIVLVGGYALAFLLLHPLLGATATVFALFPALLGAAVLGLGWALAINVATYLVTLVLWQRFGDLPGSVVLRVGSGIGAILMLVLAIALGRMRDLQQETLKLLREQENLVAALRTSERWLGAVADQLPILVIALDREGRVLRVLGAGLARIGLDPGSIEGRSVLGFSVSAGDEAAVRRALAGQPGTAVLAIAGRRLRFNLAPTTDVPDQARGAVAATFID